MQFIISHENFLLADYNSGNKLRDNLQMLVLKKKVQTDMASFKFNYESAWWIFIFILFRVSCIPGWH